MTLCIVCNQMIMHNLITEEVSVFTYEEWLSRTYGPKTLTCEMAAVVDGEVMVELTTYTIQVKTSDIGGESSAHTGTLPGCHIIGKEIGVWLIGMFSY